MQLRTAETRAGFTMVASGCGCRVQIAPRESEGRRFADDGDSHDLILLPQLAYQPQSPFAIVQQQRSASSSVSSLVDAGALFRGSPRYPGSTAAACYAGHPLMASEGVDGFAWLPHPEPLPALDFQDGRPANPFDDGLPSCGSSSSIASDYEACTAWQQPRQGSCDSSSCASERGSLATRPSSGGFSLIVPTEIIHPQLPHATALKVERQWSPVSVLPDYCVGGRACFDTSGSPTSNASCRGGEPRFFDAPLESAAILRHQTVMMTAV